MPVFNDSENMPGLVPEGDYIICVEKFESGIQTGGKTAGSEKYDLTFSIDGGGRVYETLIDHPTCNWKIDCFLKSAGIQLRKGQAFTFNKSEGTNAMPFINPLGLVCSVKLIVDEYSTKADPNTKKQKNKIAIFYTDRTKHPRRTVAASAAEEDIPFA